ncbi:MAG: transcription antitermination factor NusB [Myxococcota bacterium]|jgi:N utilization substance protein B|nr:transcription antitermination factor NusB [Myxococcota bacterium]
MRRVARSWALAILYAHEYVRELETLCASVPSLLREGGEPEGVEELALSLVNGVGEHVSALDEVIQRSSPRWRVVRMSVIDRNIMRLACYELFHRRDVPPRVVLNEAIELAKKFGAEQTRSFINGILQQVCSDNAIVLSDG